MISNDFPHVLVASFCFVSLNMIQGDAGYVEGISLLHCSVWIINIIISITILSRKNSPAKNLIDRKEEGFHCEAISKVTAKRLVNLS